MIITFIADTHWKHKEITNDIPIGDVLIHAGDFTGRGYKHQIQEFCKWYNNIVYYDHKIFIAGNHEMGFEDDPEMAKEVVDFYKTITYLQDEDITIGYENDEGLVKIYGTPWQPTFMDWAFNLPRNGEELEEKWKLIPHDTDILVTHGPPFGILDYGHGQPAVGCQLLFGYVKKIKPKIHVFGHAHNYGYYFDGDTHFINAAVLNNHYKYTNKPLTVDWNPKTNELVFL